MELWSSDGTSAGTGFLKDLRTGPLPSYGASGAPKYFVILGDELFFQARNSDVNQALWKTDGTAGGTVQVLETTLWALPVVWNGKLFFAGNDGLMSSDGTSAGTTVWTSIYPGGPFVVFNNALFMSALHIGVADETGGGRPNYELYSCDATTACALVKDIESGSKGSQPGSLTVFNNKLYFAANGGLGNELWTSDGTADGTVLVKDINPGLGDYSYDGETLQASSSPVRERWTQHDAHIAHTRGGGADRVTIACALTEPLLRDPEPTASVIKYNLRERPPPKGGRCAAHLWPQLRVHHP